MAKTAADYEQEGRDYARAARKGQTFSGIPAKYETDSWHSRAWRRGYDDEYRRIREQEHHEFVQNIVTKERPNGSTAADHVTTAPPHVAVANACSAMARAEHVRLLEAAAANEQDPARKERLLCKSRVIHARWRNSKEPRNAA